MTQGESVDIRQNPASEHGRAIQKVYFRIMAPLARLGWPHLLHRFFVHVGWLDDSEECHSQDIADLERKLEQSVMGEGYNSVAIGKREERCSAWLLWLKTFGFMGDKDHEDDEIDEDDEDDWATEDDEDEDWDTEEYSKDEDYGW